MPKSRSLSIILAVCLLPIVITIGVFVLKPKGFKTELEKAIPAAENRLVEMQHPDGRFTYREDLKTTRHIKPEYNAIRHAGAIYSFVMFDHDFPSDRTKKAIELGSHYLVEKFLFPFKNGNQELAGILSSDVAPETAPKNDDENDDEPTSYNEKIVHLGGAALGLVGLLGAETIKPQTTSQETLNKLGQYLLFMQKPNGGFYSRFRQTTGRDDSDASLYYPGEAILALVMMFERDHDAHWLEAAERGLIYLAARRQTLQETPPDNWALIATAEIWPYRNLFKSLTKSELLRHAELIANSDMHTQVTDQRSVIEGCYESDGRTTPTATRLEGLLSLYSILDNSHAELKKKIADSAYIGTRFLVGSEVKSGAFKGAIPKGVLTETHHSTEIRIDYIQHALSAFLRYRRLFP